MNIQASLPRILVYQDEDCNTLIDYLIFYGFNIIRTTESNVMQKLRESNYDLCILSHFKANIPGNLKLLHFLRQINKRTPVIIVSNLYEYSYIIDAFNAGVDDYIIRPYNLDELICRVKALLRRCGIKVRNTQNTYKIGDYIFNTESNTLTLGPTEIKITSKESKTLALLCAYKNELLSKEILLHGIWKDDNYFNKRSLDVHICRIRNYLKQDKRIKIDTIRGLGYSLTVEGDIDD